MMHQDSLKPAAIRFTLEHLQESARRSGYFLSAFFMIMSLPLPLVVNHLILQMKVTKL